MKKPLSVLISDIHYNLQTLPLADAALRQAVAKANNLAVPLIIAGDLHDTKANIRGECVNAIRKTLAPAYYDVYVIVGNHDRINEKTPEHSLNFLNGVARVIEKTTFTSCGYLIPYSHDAKTLVDEICSIRCLRAPPSAIIMHQGLTNSNAGEYYQDKSAIDMQEVSGLRIISGHYHTRQTITLPNGGQWDYIGNPYTLNFGEANDPEKGFQVLHDDGSLEFIPTNLRKHIVIKFDVNAPAVTPVNIDDLVQVRASGTKVELGALTKADVKAMLKLPMDTFKLILEPTDQAAQQAPILTGATNRQHLLAAIDANTNYTDAQKLRLKALCDKY